MGQTLSFWSKNRAAIECSSTPADSEHLSIDTATSDTSSIEEQMTAKIHDLTIKLEEELFEERPAIAKESRRPNEVGTHSPRSPLMSPRNWRSLEGFEEYENLDASETWEDQYNRVYAEGRSSGQGCMSDCICERCQPSNEKATGWGDGAFEPSQGWIEEQDSFWDEYEKIQNLNRGGQGTIDLCVRKANRELVAVKTMMRRPRDVDKSKLHNTFKRITPIVAQLKSAKDHANIMAIHSFGLSDDSCSTMMVTEYCNSGDLQQLKARFVRHNVMIPETLIWHVFWQMSNALLFLHDGRNRKHHSDSNWRSVIHRDIKPQNVLVTQNPRDPKGLPIFKLADFDMAVFCDKGDHCSGLQGTCIWQPPEQWADPMNPKATHAGDIWALGSTIQYLATPYGFINGAPRNVGRIVTPYQRLQRLRQGKDKIRPVAGLKNPRHWTPPEFYLSECEQKELDATRERLVQPITDNYSFKLHCWMCKALDFDPETRITAGELVEGLCCIIPRLHDFVPDEECPKQIMEKLAHVLEYTVVNDW